MKRVLLVRHAECVMNLHTNDTIGGQSNSSPLTPLGRRQAAALGCHLQSLPSGLGPVHTSTAVRALETAKGMLEAMQAPQLVVAASEQLLELDQGSWEGAPRSACYTPQVLSRIAADPWAFAAPGGESQQQVEERVATYLQEDVMPFVSAGGPPALVVSHGLAIKCFLRSILQSDPGMTWKIRLDNTSVTEVGWQDGGPAHGWHLLRLNDTVHWWTQLQE